MRKRNIRFLKTLIGMSLFSLLIFMIHPQIVYASQPHTFMKDPIVIGYDNIEGLFVIDGSNIPHGYLADYLNEIAAVTGWEYLFVHDNWNNLIKRTSSGEIDFMLYANYSEGFANSFLYSSYPLGTDYCELFVREDNEAYCFDEYHAFNGMTIGVERNSYEIGALDQFAKEKGFTFQYQLFSSRNDAFTALEHSTIDGVLVSKMEAPPHTKVVAKFDSQYFYAITNKRNQLLMNYLDQTLETIRIEHPSFEADIYKKNFDNQINKTSLTREELNYIKSSDPITVGVSANRKPHSYYDPKTKSFQGIFIDLLNQISDSTGLQFEFYKLPEGMPPQEAVTATDYDLILPITEKKYYKNEENFYISGALLDTTLSLATYKDFDYQAGSEYTVGIPKEFKAAQSLVHLDNLPFTVVYYSNYDDCLNALKSGEIDALVNNTLILNYLLQNPKYDNISIVPEETFSYQYCIGGKQNIDPHLKSILEKGINMLSDFQTKQIIIKQTYESAYQYNLADYAYQYRQILLLLFLGLLIILTALKMISVIRLRNKKLEFEAQTDYLTALFNRAATERFINHQLHTSPLECAFFIFDIDDFKLVNDSYGHSSGDRLLQRIGQTVHENLRPSDIAGRIGGDEFVLLLIGIKSKEAALKKARRMLEDIRTIQAEFEWTLPISVSIGISFSPKDGTSFTELYHAADDAMYDAKKSGKSTIVTTS